MSRIRSVNWRTLLFELLIIFIGLLGAFQVEEYREQKALSEARDRYLLRLSGELADYLDETESTVRFLEDTRDAVELVWDSLQAGEVVGGDTATFEHGLIYLGHLPSNPLPRTTYDEMVASGMLTALDSAELQKAISRLYSTRDFVETNFAWWRDQALLGERYMSDLVEFYDGVGSSVLMNDTLAEPNRRVAYDLQELMADRRFRNDIYWARDVRSDWVEWMIVLRADAEKARQLLQKELER